MPDRATTTTQHRKQQILEVLAKMLEEAPDTRITTARLAASVGVSEAALYRHFPSKSKMFEALLSFAEETLFARIGRLSSEQVGALSQCQGLLRLYLEFCERNPGITRLLTGRALTGEPRRLHQHQVSARHAHLHPRTHLQSPQAQNAASDAHQITPQTLPRPSCLTCCASGLQAG